MRLTARFALLFLGVFCTLLCVPHPVRAQTKTPMIGFLQNEAAQYEAEWRLHTGYYPTLVKNGMQGALVDLDVIQRGPVVPGQLYESIKPFHAIFLVTGDENIGRFTDEDKQRALIVRADLERYVREGGGLFIETQNTRYPGDGDAEFYNLILQPFGVQIQPEGIFDTAHEFVSPRTNVFAPMRFFSTSNIKPHPSTQNVKRLYLPLYAEAPNPGVAALDLSPDWDVVVRGENSAKSYLVGGDMALDLSREGTQKSAPPIAAARTFGSGRVFVYSVAAKHALLNYGNKMWPQITETLGDAAGEKPSDSNTLILNALRWVSENALQNPALGNHVLAPIAPARFPDSVTWKTADFPAPFRGVKGIVGAHSEYSDGSGSVADYVQAAKAAGLSFLVFSDPLEKLTPQKLDALKRDCAANSDANFYACPGIEYSDSIGVRWAAWGETVVWPQESFESGGKKWPVWDGQKILASGFYEMQCGYAPNAIINYQQLHKANAHPANLWWFYRIFPFAYDVNESGEKPIADNFNEYLYALRDLRYIAVDAFTRVLRPQDLARAAKTVTTSVRDVKAARDLMNTRFSSYYDAFPALQYVAQGGADGPRITQWFGQNLQMENPWLKTRGAQRVPLRFTVEADAGVKEVKIHDADFGVVRRFDGQGARVLSRDFEMVQDKQHYLVLEVVDTKGRRAISPYLMIYSYKSGLIRCGDNLNTLGSAQLVWHPDRNQMPSFVKYFENGFKYTVKGIDSGAPLATQPELFPLDTIQTTDGTYPNVPAQVVNKILDVPQSSHNIQIYKTEMRHLSEGYDSDSRPTPAFGAISRRLGPLKDIERSHLTYAPASRMDYFVTWNYRRPFEGAKDYRGSLMWHEGEVRFQRDVTLVGDVPIPLIYIKNPGGAKDKLSDHFYVTDKKDGLVAMSVTPTSSEKIHRGGVVRGGGYAAVMNTDLGYYGFFAPPESEYSYITYSDDPTAFQYLTIGLGQNGEKVKAGTVWKYRFALGTIANENIDDRRTDNAQLEDIARSFNLDGKGAGYPHTVTTGKFADAQYFFTVDARSKEAEYSIGPRATLMDVPMRVRGLDDNGCAAVYVKSRGFFRFVPVSSGIAYFQEAIENAPQMWVGNVFAADDKNLKITLVVDGQEGNAAPLLELHNPTTKPISTRIFSPSRAPLFGGMKQSVTVPAGASTRYRLINKKFVAEK